MFFFKELQVDSQLLLAFARLTDSYGAGSRFGHKTYAALEKTRTDMGYECDDFVVSVYGLPEDEEEYKRLTHRASARIDISQTRMGQPEPSLAQVEDMMRNQIRDHVKKCRATLDRALELAKMAGA